MCSRSSPVLHIFLGMTKRVSKSRLSRNKKKYWRKGIDVTDVEEHLLNESVDERQGGVLCQRADDDLFTIDRSPVSSQRLTRKQGAFLQRKRLRHEIEQEIGKVADKKPSKRSLKKVKHKDKKPVKKVPSDSTEQSNMARSSKEKPYDLWETDLSVPIDLDYAEGAEHFLKTTKKKLPRAPSTLHHISSLLPAVDVLNQGASYNPSVSNYQHYVGEIADAELKLMSEEEKLKKKLSLAPGETYVTEEERIAEESAGLIGDAEESDEQEEEQSSVTVEDYSGTEQNNVLTVNVKRKTAERKTKKQRQREIRMRNMVLSENRRKLRNAEENLLYKVKKIDKEVVDELKAVEERMKLRRHRKILKRFCGTRQIGCGKFEPEEDVFLLPEELTDSLRNLKPQGNVLIDRLKSYEKRNMLAVAGEREKSKNKRRLRFKEVEKRSYREM
ncbi:hypothetical protein AB6A40_001965 [Gnathostoma spinigerum]|uniref:Ribosome biogenesis protein NOP53 n=1 Tax=Gnathostoma spinigerum TaxID=75299 RepID=A0ABD6E7W2_9BILA